MKDDMRKPEIRFIGFDVDWEQHKLGDVVDVCSGKDYKHLSEGDVPVYGTGGYMLSVNEALSYDEDAIGIGRKGTIDKPYILKAPFWTVDTLFYAIPQEGYDLNFVYDIFQNIDWKSKDESTGVPSLSKTAINETTALMPEYDEQVEIGAFFSSINDLIALQQHKYIQILHIKKSMLNKMFPQDGAKVPEIRFSGFTDDWEQRKLGDICSSFTYGLNAAAKEFDGENKYIRITDIDDESRSFSDLDITSPDTDLSNADEYLLKKGDIVFARTGASVGKTYIYKDSDGKIYYAGFLIRGRVRPEYDAQFVYQNTLTEDYWKFIRLTSQRSGQPGVNAQEYATYEIMCPSYKEQAVLGSFLNNLDNLIALHQRKLEQLQNIKKSCLDKMFVS